MESGEAVTPTNQRVVRTRWGPIRVTSRRRSHAAQGCRFVSCAPSSGYAARVRVARAVTIFGTVTLAFVGSPHARVAGLLRLYSCWAGHGGRSTGSLRPASAVNEEPFVGFNHYTLTEEDDDAQRYLGTSERSAIRTLDATIDCVSLVIRYHRSEEGALGCLDGFGRLRRRLRERFDFTLITRPTRPSWPGPLIIYCVDWAPADNRLGKDAETSQWHSTARSSRNLPISAMSKRKSKRNTRDGSRRSSGQPSKHSSATGVE
jgi:hypothetical protein